jgi:death-on-curing family protein
MNLITLSVDDVLTIHGALVRDFDRSGDPISPPGVRSRPLLESAVGRQWTGSGNTLKYVDPVLNAATLLYGICCDHPFYNGNKRTALVSMLAHLDKNKLSLFDTKQSDLYSMILSVAEHSIAGRPDPRKKGSPRRRISADEEVQAIGEWIKKRAKRVTRGERQITYRHLERLLQRRGYYLRNPKGNSIEIGKWEEKKIGFLSRKTTAVWKRIGAVGYPGDGIFVSTNAIKDIRRICKLTEEEGVDSTAFYDEEAIIDSWLNRYRQILRRLART